MLVSASAVVVSISTWPYPGKLGHAQQLLDVLMVCGQDVGKTSISVAVEFIWCSMSYRQYKGIQVLSCLYRIIDLHRHDF